MTESIEEANARIRSAVASRSPVPDPEVPQELRDAYPDASWRLAEPMPAANFDEPVMAGSTMPPEQLEAAWGAIRGHTSEEAPPPTRRLIGIAGPAGSGKTLAASFVPDAVVVGLADPLYAGISAMFGVPEVALRARSAKESPLEAALFSTPRRLLQLLGTEWGRNEIGDTVWIHQLSRKVASLSESGAGAIVIPDVRFSNEAAWIRSNPHGLAGEVWHVRRPGIATSSHSSEAGISVEPGDVVIDNDGSAADLHAQVMRALLRARS